MSPRITLHGESATAYRGFLGALFFLGGVGLIVARIMGELSDATPIFIAFVLFGIAYYHFRKVLYFDGWKYIIWGFVTVILLAAFIYGGTKYEDYKISQNHAKKLNQANSPQQSNPNPVFVPTYTLWEPRNTLSQSTSTPSINCHLWSEISLADVGENTCVYGKAINTFSRDGAFFVIFSNAKGAFYFLYYGEGWYEGMKGNCVTSRGEIKQLGQSPVMVVQENEFYKCKY